MQTTTPHINSFSETTNAFDQAFDGQTDDWQAMPAAQPVRMTFSGKGRDYLSLWLSNWILTIVTLGIYSAWAKVRRLQYIHQNTQLAGSAFGFHGSAQAILFGRIIAVALLLLANLSGLFDSMSGVIVGTISAVFSLVLYLGYPWFINASLRFYSRNSSYRNVRFKFKGKLTKLYFIYIWGGLLTLFTAGLALPYLFYSLRRYHIQNNYWGNNKFAFTGKKRTFFAVYALPFFVTMIIFTAVSLLIFNPQLDVFEKITELLTDEQGTVDEETRAGLIAIGIIFLFFFIYKLIQTITQDLIFKTCWNHTKIAQSHFSCDLNIFKLYAIRLGCFILVVLTLGFFTPYAQMIIAKQRIESLSFTPAHDFDLNQATLDQDTTRSAEFGDMMGFDISW